MTTEEHIEYATILLDRIGDITADEIVEPVVTWWRSLSDLCMLSEVAVELFGPVPDLEQAFLVRLTELSAVIDRAADLIATYSSDWVGHGVSGTPEIGLAARSLFEACTGGPELRSQLIRHEAIVLEFPER